MSRRALGSLPAIGGAVGGLILAAGLSAPSPAQPVPEPGQACGVQLSGPILAKWRGLLGETGRMGCPSEKETETRKSPYGSGGRIATFVGRDKLGAAIVWHAAGAHAGQTYPVYGCSYRLYMQYGGPGGWLGLPIEDPQNTPDGQVQAFEGGSITFLRAEQQCSAKRNAEAPRQVAAADATAKAPLDLFYDPEKQDYLTTATAAGADAAAAAHYGRVRTEAFVFTAPGPGLSPLKLYWNEARGDNATVATAEGERQMLAAGFEFGGTQGWVWTDPQAGARTLKLFFSAERNDFMTVASPEGEAEATANGYRFVRIEGYAPTGP